MPKKPGWIWKIYFCFYMAIVAMSAAHFFSKESPAHFYYHFLMAYNPYFLIPFSLNALAIILNNLSLVPFYLFIRQKKFLTFPFWRWFFCARLAVDLTGRSYEFTFFKSLFYDDVQYALMILALVVLLHIPSYLALYVYSFQYDDAPHHRPQNS
jgi:hypothetical protein